MYSDTIDIKAVSSYTPSREIADFTAEVKKSYGQGLDIIQQPWAELNDLSVIDRMNRDQKTFNAFVDESVEDIDQAWKWRGTRSKARNKAIAMHAQITAGYIVPMFMAQNETSEEDRFFSDTMRDIVEWMVNNSNYKSSFLMATMGMLVNPVTYLGAEYYEIFQTIREKTDKGYTKTEILDEVLSGFQAPVYSADQILITNVHEQSIQKQRCIISRRYIEYGEAKAKYGEHENWDFVQRGVKSVYSSDTGLFYDVKDDAHPDLVEECLYKCRRDDTEIPFVGGIYMGNSSLEDNPIKHRDNRNAPKYNIVPFGYQRVNEHFFYYKSLMNAQYWDNMLLDAQYEMVMNRIFLETYMPLAVSGEDDINTNVIFPGSVVKLKQESKVTSLLPNSNVSALFSAMGAVEGSMDESSVSDVSAGQLPAASQKATSVNIAERNAKLLLSGVGKILAESVVQVGSLMADIALQHLTTPQVEEIVGESSKLKYRTFILNNKMVSGKEVSKVIRFDESLLGMEMTDEQRRHANLKLLSAIGYPDNTKHLYLINPELFSRMKYLTRIEPERMFPKNEEFQQALYVQLMTTFANNPFVSLEALTRKAAYAFFRGDAEEIMQKSQPGMAQAVPGQGTPQMGQQAMNSATGGFLAGAGQR